MRSRFWRHFGGENMFIFQLNVISFGVCLSHFLCAINVTKAKAGTYLISVFSIHNSCIIVLLFSLLIIACIESTDENICIAHWFIFSSWKGRLPPSCFAHVYESFTWVESSSGAKLHVWTDVLISSQSRFSSKNCFSTAAVVKESHLTGFSGDWLKLETLRNVLCLKCMFPQSRHSFSLGIPAQRLSIMKLLPKGGKANNLSQSAFWWTNADVWSLGLFKY